MSPVIPKYTRQQSIPGKSGNVLQNPANAGLESQAIAGAFKTLGNEASKFGDVLIKRRNELKKQEDDNTLIGIKKDFNDNSIAFRTKTEQDQSLNFEDMQSASKDFTESQIAQYRDIYKDRPDLLNKLQEHANALNYSNVSHFSTVASARIKTNSELARQADLKSSAKFAQAGDLALGINNFQKTLDTQLLNGSLSEEAHKLETQGGRSIITEAYLMSLVNTDSVTARKMFDSLKVALTTDTKEKLQGIINPAAEIQTGRNIGRDIFRSDTSGSLETMENIAKDKKLNPKEEDAAISEIRNSWNTRKIDEVRQIKDANSSMIAELSKKAVKGINQERDLTPAQWALWIKTDAPTAAAFQDKIRKENAEIARMDTQQRIEAEREIRRVQLENENTILLLPDNELFNIDAAREQGLGNISREGKNNIEKVQNAKDPLKNEAVRRALTLVNQGSAIADALKITGTNANEIAAWKEKYGNLVIAFAYNNFDKPDFETKLQDFMDKQIMKDMVTEMFSYRETERTKKYEAAKQTAGEMPQKAKQRVEKKTQELTKPTLQEFLSKARRVNKGVSDKDLTNYYNKKYGRL